MPEVTPVQMAGIKDDWIKALSWIPFEHVDGAFTDWLEDTENLDPKGRMIKPGIAKIKQIAADRAHTAEIRSRPRIEAPKAKNDYADTVPRSEMKAWWQAWRECGLAAPGESLDDYKDRIRARAKEIDPNVTWQMPGEQFR